MEQLKALRDRVRHGEDEIAVALEALGNRLNLSRDDRTRFSVLMAASAYLEATMFLAVKDLDNGAIDIEVAYRSVPTAGSYGRAEICGPGDDSAARGKTPAEALCAAYISAKIARIEYEMLKSEK